MPRERTSILFVDDDHDLVAALRRERQRWDMRFVASAREALESLEGAPADVVVTDMRMPEMDGAEFLREVRQMQHDGIRIVLSGQAEQADAIRAIPFAHQWLAKPTKSSDVVRIIERATRCLELVPPSPARQRVTSLKALPLPSTAFARLEALAADPTTELEDLSALLRAQPAAAARLLQMANSAFFGLPREIVDIQDAIDSLGKDAIVQLVCDGHAVREATGHERGFDFESHLLHARLTSRVAAHLLSGHPDEKCAATAGLLCDIGRIALARRSAEEAHEPASPGVCQRITEEQQAFGADHARAGAALLGIWGIDDRIVDAVAVHHNCCDEASYEAPIAAAVHVAQAAVTAALHSDDSGPLGVDARALDVLGLDGELASLRATVRRFETELNHGKEAA